MFLSTPIALRVSALVRRHFSKTISILVVLSVLAVSTPAAPRVIADVATSISPIEISAPSLPTFDTSSIRAINVAPLAAIYHNSIAFAGQMQSVILPTIPAGLEKAKLPNFGERTYGFFAPMLGLLAPTASAAITSTAPAPPPQPTSVVDFDFDNDGKADIGGGYLQAASLRVGDRRRNSGGLADRESTV